MRQGMDGGDGVTVERDERGLGGCCGGGCVGTERTGTAAEAAAVVREKGYERVMDAVQVERDVDDEGDPLC